MVCPLARVATPERSGDQADCSLEGRRPDRLRAASWEGLCTGDSPPHPRGRLGG